MESKVHIALRVDREGSVDSEDTNIGQDWIELIHCFAVSIHGTSIVDELILPRAGWYGYQSVLHINIVVSSDCLEYIVHRHFVFSYTGKFSGGSGRD